MQIQDEQHEINRLTESQLRILTLLRKVRRAAIGGAAGSGKTFLAVEKATQLAGEGFQTLLTCHSLPLARFLRELIGGLPGIEVLSVHELYDRWRREAKDTRAWPVEFDAAKLFDGMSDLAQRPYDAIIVDEGQDFTTESWLALESCLREGRQSVFYVFHDTNQTLRQGGGPLPDDMAECMIEDNVRNTQAICRTLSNHYRGDVAIQARGPEGRKVELIAYASPADLPKTLSKVLRRLLTTERFDNREIVVLTPHSLPGNSTLLTMTLAGNLALAAEPPTARGATVLCASVEQFKGLERKVAIVAELDDRLPPEDSLREAICYVAFSRPRHHLILLGQDSVLSSLAPK